MSISGIPAGGRLDAVTWQVTVRERQRDLQTLATALQSGACKKLSNLSRRFSLIVDGTLGAYNKEIDTICVPADGR